MPQCLFTAATFREESAVENGLHELGLRIKPHVFAIIPFRGVWERLLKRCEKKKMESQTIIKKQKDL